MGKLVLQIYKEDVPLTLVEVARIVQGLKDHEIHETANLMLTDSRQVPRQCDNKNHDLYKKCVGGGICLAKKYKRVIKIVDQMCISCESKVITDTLNYIFNTYYDGKYRSVWRNTRTKHQKPEKPQRKKRGEDAKQEKVEILNGMGSTKPKKEKGRPKTKKKVEKPKQEQKPKEEKIAVPTRQRQLRGRPGRERHVEAA